MLVPNTNTRARCTGDDESAPYYYSRYTLRLRRRFTPLASLRRDGDGLEALESKLPGMQPADESFFFKGDRVRLVNLKGRSDLNGCECEILTGDPSSSHEDMRYAVRVLRGGAAEENILVRPINMVDCLEECSSSAPAQAAPTVQSTRAAAAESLSTTQPAAAAAAVEAAACGGGKAVAEAQPKSAKGAARGTSSEPGAGEKLGEKQQPRLRKDGVSVIEQLMTRHGRGIPNPNPNRLPSPCADPNLSPTPTPGPEAGPNPDPNPKPGPNPKPDSTPILTLTPITTLPQP